MITCFGTITKDRIRSEEHIAIRLGGAPFFFSNVCNKLGIEHSIVSKISLEDANMIAAKGLQIEDTAELNINETENDVICEVAKHTRPIDIEKVPKELMESEIVLISPLFGEIDPNIFDKSVVALDIQGYMRDKNKRTLSENTKTKPKNLEHLLSNVDILKLNQKEAEIIFPFMENEDRLRKLSEFGPEIIIITLGKNGVIMKAGKDISSVSAKNINTLNTIGAGDTFFSAFLALYFKTGEINSSIKGAMKFTEDFLEEII